MSTLEEASKPDEAQGPEKEEAVEEEISPGPKRLKVEEASPEVEVTSALIENAGEPPKVEE